MCIVDVKRVKRKVGYKVFEKESCGLNKLITIFQESSIETDISVYAEGLYTKNFRTDSISEGVFHCFSTKLEAKRFLRDMHLYKPCVIVKCIFPEGSKTFVGDFSYCGVKYRSVCSNKIYISSSDVSKALNEVYDENH